MRANWHPPAWPVATAAVVSATLLAIRPLGLQASFDNSPAWVPLLASPFFIAYWLGFSAGLATGLAGAAALLAGLLIPGGPFNPLVIMITAGPWVAGRLTRSRQRMTQQLRARNDELLAEQEAYAAEAVRYERSRIAAELHDLVGHSLSLMVVQAGAGQRAARQRSPVSAGTDGARAALAAVAEAAEQARAEIAKLTELLAGGAGAVPVGAKARLDLIDELVRQARAVGLEVSYHLVCDGADIAERSAEAAYRVAIEALTNAVKHAPGAPVTVTIDARAGELAVTVENAAPRGAPSGLARSGGGHGLAGMRDLVTACGGALSASPLPDGGWRVHAVLPAG